MTLPAITHVLSLRFFFISLLISFLYVALSGIVSEFTVYTNIFSQQFSPLLKFKIAGLMLLSPYTTSPLTHTLLHISIALLVGMNVVLVHKKLQQVKSQKNLQWSFGAGLFTLASTGCTACGFSILSLGGAAGALTFLPFRGQELTFVTLAILMTALVYNFYSLAQTSCNIVVPPTSGKQGRKKKISRR